MAQNQPSYNPDFAPENTMALNKGKNLPQNIDAEKSVLAACMLNSEAVEELAVRLTPSNFYRPAHQLIFTAVLDLYARHIPIDQISLAENLHGSGQLEAAGGKTYLLDLADNTFALTNWKSHADIVKRTSILRDLVYASTEINALAYDAPDNLSSVVESAEQTLFRVTEKHVASDFQGMNALLGQVFEELTYLSEHRGEMAGAPTGFKDLDRLFNGLRGGDLVILAARPAVGKTSFALNMAVNSAKLGSTVAFMSLEMSATQLVQRILCSEARVNLQKVRSGHIGEGDWGAIAEATNALSKINLFIDDTPGLSILELRAKARRQLRDAQKGVLIIDYLQLMQPATPRRDGNRAVEVAEISRGLKILAKDLNIPIIALSQLSRAVESRGDKRPQLSDLRESGAIEQDADIVMFLDRSVDAVEAEDPKRPDLGVANVIVAKHRSGPTDTINLSFNSDYTRFMDYYDDSRI